MSSTPAISRDIPYTSTSLYVLMFLYIYTEHWNREALEYGMGLNINGQILHTSDMQMAQSYWQRVSNVFNMWLIN